MHETHNLWISFSKEHEINHFHYKACYSGENAMPSLLKMEYFRPPMLPSPGVCPGVPGLWYFLPPTLPSPGWSTVCPGGL